MIATLVLTLVKGKNWRLKVFYIRMVFVVFSLGLLVYFFAIQSIFNRGLGSTELKISNQLGYSVDFYVLRKKTQSSGYHIRHFGKIRPGYYRSEYLDMKPLDEYWILGYDKGRLIYFTQHFYHQGSMREEVKIKGDVNRSNPISDKADSVIGIYHSGRVSLAVIITLTFLLLFMNIILLVRRK